MNDPPRLLDPKSGAPMSRSLLRSGMDMDPPAGAKEQIWSSLSSAIAGAAGAAVLSSAPSGSVAAGAGAKGAAMSTTPAQAAGAAVGQATAVKLVAGKWILLSAISLVVVAAVLFRDRLFQGNSDNHPAVAAAEDRPKPAGGAGEASSRPVVAPDVAAAQVDTTLVASEPSPVEHRALDSDATASSATRTPPTQNQVKAPADKVAGADKPSAADKVSADKVAAADKVAGADKVSTADKVTDPAPADASDSKASRLFEEGSALADARTKLQAGDAAGAVRALADMDKRFGGGGLPQERTALLVRALAQSGQRDAAARYADAFLAAYPSSPLSAQVRPFASQ